MDTYGGGVAVLWLSIFETVAVMWIYGLQNFADDLEFMLKTKINWYWKVIFVSLFEKTYIIMKNKGEGSEYLKIYLTCH